MDSTLRPSPTTSPKNNVFSDNDTDDDGDRISTRSISLSSPTTSVAPSSSNELQSDAKKDGHKVMSQAESTATMQYDTPNGPQIRNVAGDEAAAATSTSANASTVKGTNSHRSSEAYMADAYAPVAPLKPKARTTAPMYPPSQVVADDASSMVSFASSSSKKARPESNLLEPPEGPLVPGICVVDFNHLVGPTIEFSDGDIFNDEQIISIMPFLALPDGAHMNTEDYSYFHLVPASPNPTTIFGISCNRQIRSSDLLSKEDAVTRSTVQKAVVVLASKPLFGPIRDKLGVVTQALFDQRDFRDMNILVDFRSSLELSLRSQLTESALYMGTQLRELVHKFRWRTLLLLKTLMLQKRIMFYGHPVERLCTYQYSLISLIPGLLQTLDDSGSPPLASRALTLSRATSLRTSDRKSLLAYLGLPLDVFGKDAFFQPYIPLQQVDMLKDTRSWLCGSTNSIMTQQKEIDLLVNIETNTFEFRDPNLERLVALTPADRAWMDEVVRDVNEHWCEDDNVIRHSNLQFKGSEDYLRVKFEEYVTGALASVKYADFLSKGAKQDILITGHDTGGDMDAIQDFNPMWIQDFKRTNAFEVWNRITDPMLFDIVEARHPCILRPNVVADIGLRLSEGIQELHLDQQLAPAREAVSQALASGSTSFFRAVEGVKGRWAQRSPSNGNLPANDASSVSLSSSTMASTPVEVSRSDMEEASRAMSPPNGLKPLSLGGAAQMPPSHHQTPAPDVKATLGVWGSNIGSFISQRAARFSAPTADQTTVPSASTKAPPSAFPNSPTTSVHPNNSPSPSRPASTASNASSFSFALGRASLLSTRLSASLGSVVSKPTPNPPPPPIDKDDGTPFQPRDLGEFGGNSWSGATPGDAASAAPLVRNLSDNARQSAMSSSTPPTVTAALPSPPLPPPPPTSEKSSNAASAPVQFPAGQ